MKKRKQEKRIDNNRLTNEVPVKDNEKDIKNEYIDKGKKKNFINIRKKLILYIILTMIVLYIIYTLYLLVKQPTDTFTVEEGKLYLEETDVGYVIRDEQVVRGTNYKNGREQIKLEGEKSAKNEAIFRYYSNNEEKLKFLYIVSSSLV